tara:strand:+ start:338 stop:1315 length:978 start_codon:yes stop_codon:yes gene_type:complete
MKKIIAIISGDPNSINSEIIAKTWRKKNNLGNLNIFIIGNFLLLKKQFSQIGYRVKLKKVNEIANQDFKKNLHIYNVPLKFKNPFKVSIQNRKKYIEDSFKIALGLINKKKIIGLINCAVNKKDMSYRKKFNGVTEFLAKKKGVLGKEAMLIYNNSLSVSPVTTHIKLNSVSKNISKKKIINKTITINNFFKKNLGIKPKIGVLGLNPHNDELRKDSEEKKIILPAINSLKKKGVLVQGPISPDTAFLDYKKKGFDVLIGMYHDQVLTPFKAIFKFSAINITIGLPFLRISPDHGVGKDIIKKNKSDPKSLVDSINFFKKINAKT